MLDFFRKTSWTFTSVTFRAIGTLAINKIIAVNFGASGITLLAHFQNLISLATQIPNEGVNRGIIKYWSGNELEPEGKHKLLKAGLLMNIALFLIAFVLIFIFRKYLFRDFSFDVFSPLFFVVLSVAVLLFIIHLFLLSVILSFQQIRIYSIIQIVVAILTVTVLYIAGQFLLFKYVLLSFLIAQSAGVILSGFFVFRKQYIGRSVTSFPPQGFQKLGAFVMMALSILIFGKLTDFIIRDYAIQQYGLQQAGMWQAVVRISDNYMMLFAGTVGVVFYPQISALILDREQLRKYVRGILLTVTIISLCGLILIYILRIPLLYLLFDASFTTGEAYFPFQLSGDFFNILSYLFTYIISARAQTRTFVSLQAGSAVVYAALVFILCPTFGLAGIPLAGAIRYGILFIVLVLLNKHILL